MNSKKKILLMIAVIMLLEIVLPITTIIWESGITLISNAEEIVAGDWKYTINEDGKTIKIMGYTGNDIELEIPNTIDGYTVTKIITLGYCTTITNIKIPSCIVSIHSVAFGNCRNLANITVDEGNQNYSSEDGILYNKDKTNIIYYPKLKTEQEYIIPNGVTFISNYTFSGCKSLKSIVIPSSVTTILNFLDCDSLTSVSVDENNQNYSSKDGILYDKNKTKIIYYPKAKTEQKYIMPDSVTIIDDHTFSNCESLKSIEIPNSVTSIGNYVFRGCSSLERISVDENNQNYLSEDGVLFNKDKTEIICYPAGKKEREYNIPTSVMSIACSAFVSCRNLASIEIPISVVSIEYGAFIDCTSLKSIVIPDSIESIGDSAFANCTNLTSIVIPSGVIDIGLDIFSGCTSLTIYCEQDSYAEEYAKNNNIKYKYIPLSITIKAVPIKTSYYVGESINAEGLVLIATYNNGTTEEIASGFECTPSILNTAGTQTITVSCGGKTTTFNVIVVLKGDANGDSKVDFMDILAINKHRLNKEALTGASLKAADVTGDGQVNFQDILQINKYRLGKIDSL